MTQSVAPSETRSDRRLITVVGLLLMVQALGILALAGSLLYSIDWEAESQYFMPSELAVDAAIFGICFIPIALAAILIAIAFLFVRRQAWILATLTQGLMLGGCLYLYFVQPDTTIGRTVYVYAIMLSGVLLMLYLNAADVRLVFQRQSAAIVDTEEADESGP